MTADHEAARAALNRALDLHTVLRTGRRRAYALVQLGALCRATGELDSSREYLYQALTGYHDAGDRIGMAFAHSQLLWTEMGNSHLAEATREALANLDRGSNLPVIGTTTEPSGESAERKQ